MKTFDPTTLWESVLTELQLSLSGANYQTWFKGKTNILSITDGKVEIGCSSSYNKTWLEERYLGQLKEIVNRITDRENTLIFAVTSEIVPPSKVNKKRESINTTPLFEEIDEEEIQKHFAESNIIDRYSFSNFLVGQSNQLAYAVAKSISDSPDANYNPLLFHGGVGVGKTHLLQAIGHATCIRKPNAKVLYASSETFTNDMVDAIQRKQTLSFREKYRNLDLLLLDDVQFIAGRESTQEQFFHTFNEIYRKGGQIVLTCDKNPEELFDIQERLKNRFVGGMVAKIDNPDLELREAILLAKSRESKAPLDFQTIRYLAESLGPSIRELEGALLRIGAVAKLANKPVTQDLVDNVIGKQKKSAVTPGVLVENIAEYFSIPVVDIKGVTRAREALLPRQIVMYLMRKDLNLSFARIGKFFGGKDHTTVIYSVHKVESMVEKDEEIHRLVEALRVKAFGS